MNIVKLADLNLSAAQKKQWADLRLALWPKTEAATLEKEIPDILSDKNYTVFFVVSPKNAIEGFMEICVRPFVNGAKKSPTPHIEGWYVRDEARGSGAGKGLLAAAQDWALAQGFTEITSDADINNAISVVIHERTGFTETERVIYFRKALK